MEWIFGDYRVSTDKTLLDIDKICEFLNKSYWANDRPREVVEKSIGNSICFGVFHDDKQVGFARAITDFATFYWICDVFIDETHRGRGLGKKLVQCIVEADELKDLKGALATMDAHGLYEQFGFQKDDGGRYMRRAL